MTELLHKFFIFRCLSAPKKNFLYIFISIFALFILINLNIILYSKSTIVFTLILLSTIFIVYFDWKKSLLLAVSIALPLIFLELTLKYGFENLIFYRPHEKVSLAAKQRYLPDISLKMVSPHGDMLAIDPQQKAIKEQRTVFFKTDNLGYRNNKNFTDQRIVIVGDSFVVGNGTSQEDILPSILEEQFNLDVYNISYPGGPDSYLNRIESFPYSIKDRCVFVFFFEGNDFPESLKLAPPQR